MMQNDMVTQRLLSQWRNVFIVGIVFSWLFLWFAPWNYWLQNQYWLQLGIALIVFIIPGAILYGFISRDEIIGIKYLTFGFVLSHLILAILGTAGRIFHFSFVIVENGMMLLGLFFILLRGFSKQKYRINTFRLRDVWAYLPLFFIIILTALMTIQRVITDDDLAYLARITNWQYMPSMNFLDVYFGANELDSSRMWIVSTPFSQAFLSQISGLPGLLILGGYYEPFLVAIALIVLYDLARTLGLSHRASMAAVVVQVVFLSLLSDYPQLGFFFFRQLSTDKVTAAFIFAPVLFQSLFAALVEFRSKRIILCFLIVLSLSLLHPVILLYTIIIASVIMILGIRPENLKSRLVLLGIFSLAMLPHVIVRFSGHASNIALPYDIQGVVQAQEQGFQNMVTTRGKFFYGFSVAILSMKIPYGEKLPLLAEIFKWCGLILSVVISILALKDVKNSNLSKYVLSSFLLVAFAGIPFTGWMLGFFVSAKMLDRTVWLYPFGLGLIYFLMFLFKKIQCNQLLNKWNIKIINRLQVSSLAIVGIWIIAVSLLLLVMRVEGLPNFKRLHNVTQRYLVLSYIGQYFDVNLARGDIVVGSDDFNDYIPAISWRAKVISYRPSDPYYPYFFTMEERSQRKHDRLTILSASVSPADFLEILRKYDVRFILLNKSEYEKMSSIIVVYPDLFNLKKFGSYYLVGVQ